MTHPHSLWKDTAPKTSFPPLTGDIEVDVAIVGGGITGITAALLLKNAGQRVAVVELDRIGLGETGNTTAHITEAIDSRYQLLIRDFGESGARLAAESSREAMELIGSLVSKHGIECSFERVPGYLYTEHEQDVKKIDQEFQSALKLGIDVKQTTSVPLPFPVLSAVVFRNQAQFHPRRYLLHLAGMLTGGGSHVFENSRAIDVQDGSPCVVKTEQGTIRARSVIVSAHVPVNDLVFIHTKIAAYRSYAIAAPFEKPLPGLFWDTDDPYHYIRTQTIDGKQFVMVGGEDHKTGQNDDSHSSYERLIEYARSRFGVSQVSHRWSGQIIEPVDGLPYIGRNSLQKNVFIATGYGGQGMTMGTVAAMVLADLATEKSNRYAELYDATRIKPLASVKNYVKENLSFPAHFISSRIANADVESKSLDSIAPGQGKIVSIEGKKIAACRSEKGELSLLSPVCPHLKCDVAWNNAEQSWDCPCHGSRFTPSGRVINGPAIADLEPIEESS